LNFVNHIDAEEEGGLTQEMGGGTPVTAEQCGSKTIFAKLVATKHEPVHKFNIYILSNLNFI